MDARRCLGWVGLEEKDKCIATERTQLVAGLSQLSCPKAARSQ